MKVVVELGKRKKGKFWEILRESLASQKMNKCSGPHRVVFALCFCILYRESDICIHCNFWIELI